MYAGLVITLGMSDHTPSRITGDWRCRDNVDDYKDEWDGENWDDYEPDEPGAEDDGSVPCPHCGESVYEDAEHCPHCERYLSCEGRAGDSQAGLDHHWILGGDGGSVHLDQIQQLIHRHFIRPGAI